MDTQNPNQTDENQEQPPTQMPPDLSRGSQPPVGTPQEGGDGEGHTSTPGGPGQTDERHDDTDTDSPTQPIPESPGK